MSPPAAVAILLRPLCVFDFQRAVNACTIAGYQALVSELNEYFTQVREPALQLLKDKYKAE